MSAATAARPNSCAVRMPRKRPSLVCGTIHIIPLRANNPACILTQRSRSALVEGKAASVHQSGSALYLNFGPHWSQNFTVTSRKRNERNFVAVGIDLRGLAGRSVRARGWIEAGGAGGDIGGDLWRAPWIESTHPERPSERADRDRMRMMQ
jgi:hypothetical protein